MTWNPKAWQRHLELARAASRYSSNSYDDLRFYWIEDHIMVLNQATGECRKSQVSQEEESKLLYSPNLEVELHRAIWERGV